MWFVLTDTHTLIFAVIINNESLMPLSEVSYMNFVLTLGLIKDKIFTELWVSSIGNPSNILQDSPFISLTGLKIVQSTFLIGAFTGILCMCQIHDNRSTVIVYSINATPIFSNTQNHSIYLVISYVATQELLFINNFRFVVESLDVGKAIMAV